MVIATAGVAVGLGATHVVTTGTWKLLAVASFAIPLLFVLWKYPFLGFGLWMIFVPFLVETETATQRKVFWIFHRALPPAMVCLIIMRWRGELSSRLARVGWPELAMAGYILVALFSIALYHEEPLRGSYILYDRVFSPMCLYVLLRFSCSRSEDVIGLRAICIFVVLSQALLGLVSWTVPEYLPTAWLGRAGERTVGSLGNPAGYSLAMIFCGGILLHSGANERGEGRRTLYATCALIAFCCVFFTMSRGSWLAGLVAFAGFLYLYPRLVMRLCLIGVPFFILLGVSAFSQHLSFAGERLVAERSVVGRLAPTLAAIRMFLEKPLFGWGYENFDQYDRRFQTRVAGIIDDNKDHASHNTYLTLLAEQGVVGFTLFLIPAAWWLALSRRKGLQLSSEGFWSRKLLCILWLSIVACFIISNFSNAHMRREFAPGLWWATLGLIASLLDPPCEKPRSAVGRPAETSNL